MDVVDFVREFNRMCDNYDICRECLMDVIYDPCMEAVYKDPQRVVSIVEKWSKEHPIKTRADKFKEVFGIAPEYVQQPFKDRFPEDNNWWDRPYEEPKEDE